MRILQTKLASIIDVYNAYRTKRKIQRFRRRKLLLQPQSTAGCSWGFWRHNWHVSLTYTTLTGCITEEKAIWLVYWRPLGINKQFQTALLGPPTLCERRVTRNCLTKWNIILADVKCKCLPVPTCMIQSVLTSIQIPPAVKGRSFYVSHVWRSCERGLTVLVISLRLLSSISNTVQDQ